MAKSKVAKPLQAKDIMGRDRQKAEPNIENWM